MEGSLAKRNATPDEVLRILTSEYANRVECEEADDIEIDFDTTVYNWFVLDDLVLSRTWVSNARMLNEFFDIDESLREWKQVLTPSRSRTLRDLCGFIALKTTVLFIPETKILGKRCRETGAFLAIRRLLKQSAIDVANVRPRTALDEYAERGLPEIYQPLLLASPELIDRLRVSYHSDAMHMGIGVLLFFATIFAGFLAFGFHAAFLPVAATFFGAFLYVWHDSIRRVQSPCQVAFDGMRDFRDLARALAACDRTRSDGGHRLLSDGM